MRGRIASSLVVAAGIIIGTAGCNLVAPQATTNHYFASDGVNVDLGDMLVRNALVVSDGESSGNLVFTLVNNNTSAARVRVEYQTSTGKDTSTVRADAEAATMVGAVDADQTVTMRDIVAKPGSLMKIYFTSGDEAKLVDVPVLDGSLPEYEDLVPAAERPIADILSDAVSK